MVMENSTSSGERELPERWSARRKSEIVLRLLRGEDLGELSREILNRTGFVGDLLT